MLHIILDVDGVTRLDVTSAADPRVITQVNKILELEESCDALRGKLRFTFLSGSHSTDIEIPAPKSPQSLPPSWRTPNLPLAKVFDKCFPKSAFDKHLISIYGQLGCDTAVVDESKSESPDSVSLTGQVLNGFDTDDRMKLLAIVLHSYGEFLRDTNNFTQEEFEQYLTLLRAATYDCMVTCESKIPESHTPDAFEAVAAFAREKSQDALLRIVSLNGNAEMGAAPKKNPNVDYRVECLKLMEDIKKKVVNHKDANIRALLDRVSCGVAHLDGGEFIWAVITCSNKGIACSGLLKRLYDMDVAALHENNTTNNKNNSAEEKPSVTLITVGDSHVDFSMHELTSPEPGYKNSRNLHNVNGNAFHVGPPSTLTKMTKQEPEKYTHVTQVNLSECKTASKIKCATEEEESRLEHLYGKTDVMPLTTGTLEVLIRLEELLRKKFVVGDEKTGEKIDFGEITGELARSFPQ